MPAPAAIEHLIEKFEASKHDYQSGKHKEAQVRQSLIDPFFEALGWDMTDTRQVRQEPTLDEDDTSVFPDYGFHIHNNEQPTFYVEAKGVYVDIGRSHKSARQVRRYSSSSKHAIAILTDFEELSIYNGLQVVKEDDEVHIARLDHIEYTEYVDRWDEIESLLSRQAVINGSLEEYAGTRIPKGTETVDEAFLRTLEGWRQTLAHDIYEQNRHLNLTDRELNIAVQRTIDRIVFLRITESRGIAHPQDELKRYLGGDVYENLKKLFRRADDRFNSGIFHFVEDRTSEVGDAISMKIHISPEPLRDIINSIYYPKSPYEFSVMPADILGQVYERFLGSVITHTDDGISIEQKPEVRKAGGVYYTPTYIVDYIVENTVGKLLEGKNPAQAKRLRILDPACGSGSFLLGAYQHLMDWHLDHYRQRIADNPNSTFRHRTRYVTADDGTVQVLALNVHEKRRILVNNLYGVDLDQQAVEVTKLSLLLKMLENETVQTTADARPEQIPLVRGDDRLLPPLHENVKWGNSLIASDFYDDKRSKQLSLLPEPEAQEELYRVRYFDWESKKGFESIMQAGGFDAVIGNPPYVRQEILGKTFKDYASQKYETYAGTADLYTYFIERSVNLLAPEGFYAVIVANKWLRTRYGKNLRKWLKSRNLTEIIDFGDLPVFPNATTYPCIITISNTEPEEILQAVQVETLKFSSVQQYVSERRYPVLRVSLDDAGWALISVPAQLLIEKLQHNNQPLKSYINDNIYYGIKTGLNKAFVIDEATRDELIHKDPRSAEIIKPFLRGRDVKRYIEPDNTVYLILIPKGWTDSRTKDIEDKWGWLCENYSAIAEHLAPFEKRAAKRYDQGEYWWELRACDYYAEFEKPKIIFPDISLSGNFTFDSEAQFYTVNTTYIMPTDDIYFLGILNSKLISWFYRTLSPSYRGGYLRFIYQYLVEIPIRKIDFNNPTDVALHDEMVQHVKNMLAWHKELATVAGPMKKLLEDKIASTDHAIDQLVYKLYDLTPDEIAIVEGTHQG